MAKKILTACMLFAVILTYAQKSVVTTGGEASGSGGTASYSVGQISYRNVLGSSFSDSQGVQHGYKITELAEKQILPGTDSVITIYPNPTDDLLNIHIGTMEKGLSYELLSVAGALLTGGKLIEATTTVEMKNYAQGSYLIRITWNEKTLRTFKIIKH